MKIKKPISSFAFILSSLSSAVGLGSIWGFPVKINQYGWGFLIPFLIALILCGLPILWIEINLGNWLKKNHIKIFSYFSKKWGVFIGWLQTFVVAVLSTFYLVLLAWVLISSTVILFNKDDEPIKWINIGEINWLSIFFSLITLTFVFFVLKKGVSGGIDRISKIFIPIFFLVLISLTIWSVLFLKKTEIVWNWQELKKITLWKEAFGQAFFLLSTSTGTIIIYSAFSHKEKNNFNKVLIIIITTIIICLLISLIINCLSNITIIKSGPALFFEVIPYLFISKTIWPEHLLFLGKTLGLLFFIFVFFIGFTSLIGQIESLINGLENNLKIKRLKGLITSLIIIFIISTITYNLFYSENLINLIANWVASTWLLFLTFVELVLIFFSKKIYPEFKKWVNRNDYFKLNKLSEFWIFFFVPLLAIINFIFAIEQIYFDFLNNKLIFSLIAFFLGVIIPIFLSFLFTWKYNKVNKINNKK
jgi:neurotransmitter:Na+ symporter, NSS family